ncbi:MATE family efflux transporter [Spirosoma utsteinense]|uniref:Na+-driven multidrug efflux pump n=1 Tax=Spirosoma utsteinense TaxID=2585773 RepID=A0ABR6W1L5_9BACT|nr:MATE family efflux transporter [Spirosoma utsteinense]MBC3790501.1 Na+-driven multidrug efflux pump [Spirosoma utsteinense]
MNTTEQPVISDLGHAPVRSLFFRFYGPSLVSMASIALHQIINGIILGQQLGKEALAAISLYTPVLFVFIAFVLAVMIGGGILFSKRVGAQRYDEARQVFRFCTTLVVLVSGLVALYAPFITPFLVSPRSLFSTRPNAPSGASFFCLLFCSGCSGADFCRMTTRPTCRVMPVCCRPWLTLGSMCCW